MKNRLHPAPRTRFLQAARSLLVLRDGVLYSVNRLSVLFVLFLLVPMASPSSSSLAQPAASGEASSCQESKDSIEAIKARIDHLLQALKDGQACGILGKDGRFIAFAGTGMDLNEGEGSSQGLPTGTDVLLKINSEPVKYIQASSGNESLDLTEMFYLQ